MQRRSAFAIEHVRDRAFPPARFVGSGDLRQDRVANPLCDWDALDRQDLRQSLGPRHAHLVVDDVVHDERPALDAPELERWSRDAVGDCGRRQDFKLPVVQQRAPAPQPVKERQIERRRGGAGRAGGAFPGKGDRRSEGRVPIRADAVPVGIVVACFHPQPRGHELSIDTGRLLGREEHGECGEHAEKRQRTK